MTVHATTSIADALAHAVARHSRSVAKRSAAATEGQPDAVHRTRVASRRLREALAVVGAAGMGPDLRDVERALRRLTRALGPVREMDVALDVLETAAHRHGWPADRVAAIGRLLERERDRRRRKMAGNLSRVAPRAFVSRGREIATAIVGAASAEDEWWRALTARITRRATRVTAAIAECGVLYAPDRLHALRIAAKKLRYALEFLPATPGVNKAPTTAALRHAQQQLGHLHDIQFLLGRIDRLSARGRRGLPASDVAALVASLERDCRRIHASLLPRLPGLQTHVTELRRELGARRPGRRLMMARAEQGKGEVRSTKYEVQSTKYEVRSSKR